MKSDEKGEKMRLAPAELPFDLLDVRSDEENDWRPCWIDDCRPFTA